ncbi:MAG: hypothetical protein Alpg2KO_29480 [Alphaproteobacteria bacterium]
MHLDFWINAFIGGKEDSATKLRRGPYRGHTAMPLPNSAFLHPLNLAKLNPAGLTRRFLKGFKDGLHSVAYLTDQRGFTPRRKGVTQRMRSHLRIDVETGEILQASHVASPTIEVAMSDGQEKAQLASLLEHRSRWTADSRQSLPGVKGGKVFTYKLDANGSDPLVWGASLRPVSYGGELRVEVHPAQNGQPQRIKTSFEGDATLFPWFEGYVSAERQIRPLFTLAPASGTSVESVLLGRQIGRLTGSASLDLPTRQAKISPPSGTVGP